MRTLAKLIVAGTVPALVVGALGAQAETTPATQPATQPSAQPATQPAAVVAQSNEPLVIPDGTSLQNPGPPDRVNLGQGSFGNGRAVFGLRG